MRKRHTIALASAGALSLAAAAPAVAAPGTGTTGPTTAVAPYVLPVADGVQTTSLLTVGDKPAANGYRMVGIPDGLGARLGSDGAVEVFMNHELGTVSRTDPTPVGVTRRHGQKGAFVANLKVNKTSLAVTEGKDLIGPNQIKYYDYPSKTFGPTPSSASPAGANPLFLAQGAAFNRFCSATLTEKDQLINPSSGKGFAGQIFFGNEESGAEGRIFGILDDGTTKQLPRLGLAAWENTVPARNRTDTTLVHGLEDGGSAQLWSYVGQKTSTGDAFDKAGLTNGKNYVIDALDETVSTDAQFRDKFGKGVPTPVDFTEIDSNQPGAKQNADAAAGGLSLNRIEDGSWDPSNPRDFYFHTTEGGDTTPNPATPSVTRDGGGLWRLRYKNIENPLAGATLTLLLDGSEAPYLSKPDNMTIDTHGNLLMQEDPGNNAVLARIVAYDIDTGRRGVAARFDPALFSTPEAGSEAPRTIDEESSGIIDTEDTFGDGTFLFDAQIHRKHPDPELVEYGQLLLLEVEDFEAVYTGRAVIRDGVTGAAGPNGQPGAQGPAGAPGRALQGPAGARGPAGPAGTTAPSGSGGTNARANASKLSIRTTPGTDTTSPYRFTTTGKLTLPVSVRRTTGCKGVVSVQIKAGKKTISTRGVKLTTACTYRSRVTFTLPRRVNRRTLRIQATFAGNRMLNRRQSSRITVRVRR